MAPSDCLWRGAGYRPAARYRLSDGLADRLAGMDARTDAVIKV